MTNDVDSAHRPEPRAFSVSREGFQKGIYFAESASKAKAMALAQARDAGYVNTMFADLKVRRAPEFDGATYCGETPRFGVLPDCLSLP